MGRPKCCAKSHMVRTTLVAQKLHYKSLQPGSALTRFQLLFRRLIFCFTTLFCAIYWRMSGVLPEVTQLEKETKKNMRKMYQYMELNMVSRNFATRFAHVSIGRRLVGLFE